MTLFTIGHGTLGEAEFAALLHAAGVTLLVDVRTAPGSRHNPQFGRLQMERWLPSRGVAYRWDQGLGGFRKTRPDSVNTGLRHPAFRGYADYMATPQFAVALRRVLDEAERQPVAVMCSESVWWRCHRRLVSDAATLQGGVDVVHLMHDGSLRAHQLTGGATLRDGVVVYPGGELFDPPA